MTRGDDTAAAHIPTQPSASDAPDDLASTSDAPDDFASTSDAPDDFVDTDAAPGGAAERDRAAEQYRHIEPETDTDAAVGRAAAPEAPAPVDRPGLDDRSKEILAFERRWWRQAGSKEQAIRDTFGLSATRYYQLLNALLDDPAALEHEPVVVQRLRRLRASRIRTRGSGRRQ